MSPNLHAARLAGSSLLRLQSDERLAALARAGHDAAFAALVDRHRPALVRYCAGLVGPDRAEDTVQQTLLNAHRALDTTAEVMNLRSWLYRVAHNAALNVLRAVRDELPLDDSRPATDLPDVAVERAEEVRATLRAVHDLPERQRAALVLRELEGRSHEEIAAALGVTAGAARQHLARARAAVRHAVTALTPYPLIARLAEMAAQPASGAAAEAVAGAGLGATLAKLGAGVAATGALAGGVVGTDLVLDADHPASPTARAAQAAGPSAAGAAPDAGRGSAADDIRFSDDDSHADGDRSGRSGEDRSGPSGEDRSGPSGDDDRSGPSGDVAGDDRSGSSGDDNSGPSGGEDTSGTSGSGSSGSGSSGSGSSGSGSDDD